MKKDDKKLKRDSSEMEELKSMMAGLMKTMNEVKDQIGANHADLKGEICKNTAAIDKLKREYEEKEKFWQQEKEELRGEIQLLRKRIEGQDRKNRGNNIVVRGLQFKENKPKEAIGELLEKELHIHCPIKAVSIIKAKEKAPIIIAELENYTDKERIMKNKNKLKGKEIYIDNDSTKEERNVQAIIRKKAKEEECQGKKVKIFYNRLLVNGKNFKWNTQKRSLEEQAMSDKTGGESKN